MPPQKLYHEMLPVGAAGPNNMVLVVQDLLPELRDLIKAALQYDPAQPTHLPSGALNYQIAALQHAAASFWSRQKSIPPAPWSPEQRAGFLKMVERRPD